MSVRLPKGKLRSGAIPWTTEWYDDMIVIVVCCDQHVIKRQEKSYGTMIWHVPTLDTIQSGIVITAGMQRSKHELLWPLHVKRTLAIRASASPLPSPPASPPLLLHATLSHYASIFLTSHVQGIPVTFGVLCSRGTLPNAWQLRVRPIQLGPTWQHFWTIYIYIYIYIIHTYIHTYIHKYIHIHIRLCLCVCMQSIVATNKPYYKWKQ